MNRTSDFGLTLPPVLRVGCVGYLNSKPLIHGHSEQVQFQHPSALADDLAFGRLDVGLVPIFELLRQPSYLVVDDVAIACRGRVHSVFLAHRGRLGNMRRVRLDQASRTSVSLLRVILAEFHGLSPVYEPLDPGWLAEGTSDHDIIGEDEGVLLIGDQAIAFRDRHKEDYKCRIFDLGEQWQLATGLPFVFAAWLMRPDAPLAPLAADTLRLWRDQGCGPRLDEVIAEAEKSYPPGFAAYYLTKCIRYHLGAPEKQAIVEYGRLLHKHGLIEADVGKFRWI